jgi:hypothetical protein
MGRAARARIVEAFTLDQMGAGMEALLDEAISTERERVIPSPIDARAAACEAMSAPLWQWPDRPKKHRSLRVAAHARVAVLSAIAAVGRPIYRLSERRGYRWLEPAKRTIVRALLGHD